MTVSHEERPHEERHREERPRQEVHREERPREEVHREERPHEERHREERPREERPRQEVHREERPRDPERERPPRRPALDARGAARRAAHHVAQLTGRDPEGVTSLEHREDGWAIGIEVVETHRIPDSTDILAEYRVELDDHGELVTYRRTERYPRGRAENRT